MYRATRVSLLALLLLTAVALASTLKLVSSFDLPGPAGKRFDYLTIDYDDQYLLSAHLAAGLLHVIDLRTNEVVKSIPDVPGVEGVEFVPELKKVYTSNAGDNTIGVIDLKQMKVIKKLPTEAKPDAATRMMCALRHSDAIATPQISFRPTVHFPSRYVLTPGFH
jgi:YVTN family beta-propeller protein